MAGASVGGPFTAATPCIFAVSSHGIKCTHGVTIHGFAFFLLFFHFCWVMTVWFMKNNLSFWQSLSFFRMSQLVLMCSSDLCAQHILKLLHLEFDHNQQQHCFAFFPSCLWHCPIGAHQFSSTSSSELLLQGSTFLFVTTAVSNQCVGCPVFETIWFQLTLHTLLILSHCVAWIVLIMLSCELCWFLALTSSKWPSHILQEFGPVM